MAIKKRSGHRRPPGKKKVKKFPDVFAGKPLTQNEFEEFVRFIEFRRRHKRLERQRKRTRRKRVWPKKPGR